MLSNYQRLVHCREKARGGRWTRTEWVGVGGAAGGSVGRCSAAESGPSSWRRPAAVSCSPSAPTTPRGSYWLSIYCVIANESVPIQLTQCRFRGLAISSAETHSHSHRHARHDKTISSVPRPLRRCELDSWQLRTVADRKFEICSRSQQSSNSHRHTRYDTDRTVLSCLVWRCELDIADRTRTHPFNGPLSGTTWVGRYQKGKTNLDYTEARDSEWQ